MTKRLTDEQVANGYAKGWGAPALRSLKRDHLQAREDVRRLAKMLARVLAQMPTASLMAEAEAMVDEVGQ